MARDRFPLGAHLIYPAQGVTEVVAVHQKEVGGRVYDFYVLRVLDSEQKIMVPVERAREIGLRPPASAKDIRDLFLILEEAPPTDDEQTWNKRYRGFIEKIKTGSLAHVAEIVRDLHRSGARRELSFSEKKVLETAQKLLIQELAVSRGESEDAARREIEAALSSP